MLVKIYGVLDIISAIALIMAIFDFGGWRLPFFTAMYLMIKGLAYWGNLPSFLDLIIGIYTITALFFSSTIIGFVAAGYIGFKGFQSVFS